MNSSDKPTLGESLYLHGMRVVVHPFMFDIPKIKIAPSCPCTDGVRNMLDAQLLDMFGTKPDFVLAQTGAKGVKVVYTTPAGYDLLEKVVRLGSMVNG